MRDFPDLIRNYKLLLKRRGDFDSDNESQPLASSGSSSLGQSYGSRNGGIFRHDSDETDFEASARQSIYPSLPDRVCLGGKAPELEAFESIYRKYEDIDKPINEVLTGERTLTSNNDILTNSFDFCHPEFAEPEGHTHSSLVTIFAIWNTTVGTSLLSMSWGIEKTGLFPAMAINIAIAAICLYTTYTLLKINERHGVIGHFGEVSDLCRALIGRWAEILAKIFSLVVLIGANIVYWILMANFLYNIIHFFHGLVLKLDEAPNNATVLCPRNDTVLIVTGDSGRNKTSRFEQFWDLYSTVPVILALIMFPMLNWKSPTFFTKFNSLGTFSVLYLIVFVAAKAATWGIHIPDWSIEFHMKSTFCALSGMLSMSYFIHNIIISIMRNNKHQRHNGRDLTIAFGLITFTYLFIGVLFYITFPLPKFCIEDNFLNNFNQFDTLAIIARILLLFQLFTVFPLISYMLRNDIFANINMIFKNSQFGRFTYTRVIILNLGIVLICILFACFLPRIGTLIRYTGALSGMVYIFMLPSLLKMASLKKTGGLSPVQIIFHTGIIFLGVLNLLLQFFINDK